MNADERANSENSPAQIPPPSTQPLPPDRKAWQSPAAWILFLIPAGAGLACDLLLKSYAFPNGVPTDPADMPFSGRQPGTVRPLLDHLLGFTTTVNQGAVFGIAQGHVGVFLAFSVLALAVILWVFATSGARHYLVHVALGMITAGAIGNLYDRAIYHGVRDMLRFYVRWYPYIFNLADALLCVGVPLLLLCWMVDGYVQSKAAHEKPA